MKASRVLLGQKVPKGGDLIIWRKGNTIFGHIGFVLTWDGACGTTIEANTSDGAYGSQSNGDGVYVRERCIQPGNYFRIVSFTPVTYAS